MATRIAIPTVPASMAVMRVVRFARKRSPTVTPKDAAIYPDTASAMSMTSAHHHSEDAAATIPSTSRGTISLQPVCICPRCS